ncbi:hypothetical protein HYH03_014875 [Edaphochlamys debaryana]|uniref:Uncharacterized protein n=1 Tax=Edaphochlamys debaryana TaxID=47281 RepID=A0A835XP87_9CHLO|nr:hypothetical protein HYH03_014875 [Edaphochlamys debaryana]|eukprot:KAG2486428.1 hypothetical protein HYH03_014875 [Edaphochlamys debaryana]
MFASSDKAWLYLTDQPCSEGTSTTACRPSSNPTLQSLQCTGVSACQRSTPQPWDVPLCLVVANTDGTEALDVDLVVSGTFEPSPGGGGDDGGLSNFEIVLIVVGSCLGGLVALLLCCLGAWLVWWRVPPGMRVAPAPTDDMSTFAAKSLAALPAYPPGMGPSVMKGTLTLLPPAALGHAPPGRDGPVVVPYTATLSSPILPPLPPGAYGSLGAPGDTPSRRTLMALPPPQQAQHGQHSPAPSQHGSGTGGGAAPPPPGYLPSHGGAPPDAGGYGGYGQAGGGGGGEGGAQALAQPQARGSGHGGY